uniref:THAP domain-containing protein 1-like n=1 Tax=Myxine glutinosa TaxID=7769 RepID=UPI00358F54BB
MPSCAAINCTNRLVKGSGKTFHRFPKDGSTLQKEWLVKMRRDKWTPSKYASLCSDHFDAECFDRTGLITRLRQGSIPTIFNFPNHLQKTVKQRKPPRPRTSQNDSPTSSSETPQCLAGSSSKALPTSPIKQHHHDHTYFVSDSPRGVKRKLDKMQDIVISHQKRLKNTQRKSRRLRKKVDTLETVVNTLKQKNLMSEQGLDMLQASCNVPAELMKRLVKAKSKDGPTKEKYPPE